MVLLKYRSKVWVFFPKHFKSEVVFQQQCILGAVVHFMFIFYFLQPFLFLSFPFPPLSVLLLLLSPGFFLSLPLFLSLFPPSFLSSVCLFLFLFPLFLIFLSIPHSCLSSLVLFSIIFLSSFLVLFTLPNLRLVFHSLFSTCSFCFCSLFLSAFCSLLSFLCSHLFPSQSFFFLPLSSHSVSLFFTSLLHFSNTPSLPFSFLLLFLLPFFYFTYFLLHLSSSHLFLLFPSFSLLSISLLFFPPSLCQECSHVLLTLPTKHTHSFALKQTHTLCRHLTHAVTQAHARLHTWCLPL